MSEETKKDKFRFTDNLERTVLSIYEAATKGIGIFEGGYDVWKRKYLPECGKLPKELEFSPQRVETKHPLEAAEYLWTALSFEKRNISRILHGYLNQVWNNPEKRWFFKAKEVIDRPIIALEEVIISDIHFNLNSPVPKFYANAKKLQEEYGGDPRNLIEGQSVVKARERLMEFEGISTGNANLAILQFLHRNLASPVDPENALFKIDIHKARIPLNVDGILLLNGDTTIHASSITSKLEEKYWEICNKHKLNPVIADSALWVLGSEGCAKRSLAHCLAVCPLQHNGLCKVNTLLERKQGGYLITDKNGKRSETRREANQIFFTSFYEEGFK